MQIIRQLGAAPKTGTALALGYFDGLHKGHVEVIQAAVEAARAGGLAPAVFTFTRGQAADGEKKRIQTEAQKHQVLQELGVEFCFEPPFESFQNLSPEAFFTRYIQGWFGAKALFCGENFSFGAKRAGNTGQLSAFCRQNGLRLRVLRLATYKGAPVSSSRIRGTLAMGDIPDVNAMLGRPYEICFPVQRGQGLGRAYGFPTINQIFPPEMQPPKPGVYITSSFLEGAWLPSATGYGSRPTVGGEAPTCETFIPHFQGNLYGAEVRVRFYEHLCEVRPFASPEELAVAVQGWARQSEEYFAGAAPIGGP